MQLTIFAKRGQSKDGKNFNIYLGRLVNKNTGEDVNVRVKFREDAGQPKPERCPMNIIVDKKNANFTTKELQNEETGQTIVSNTLWVTDWKKGAEYVDHSMDEFD